MKHQSTKILLFSWLSVFATLQLVSFIQWHNQPLLSPLAQEVQAYETPTKDKKTERLEKLYRIVHELESNNGTAPAGHHLDCKALGKVNEIGYVALDEYCFDSIHAQISKFMDYMGKIIDKGYTDSEALCYYNTGKASKLCEYSKNAGILLVTKLSK